jgi:hypothetical protein
MMSIQTKLEQFARTYFHQDYDLVDGTPDDVVRAFIRGDRSGVQSLAAEIESLLASQATENDLDHLWTEKYEASYDPTVDGYTYRYWFSHVVHLLRTD